MPADNYYPDMPEDASPSTPAPDKEEGNEYEDSGEKTATLPKWILEGKKFEPGDELVVEIVHIYEDEVEVKYAKGKEGSEEEEAGETEEEEREEQEGGMMRRRRGRPRGGMDGAMDRLNSLAGY